MSIGPQPKGMGSARITPGLGGSAVNVGSSWLTGLQHMSGVDGGANGGGFGASDDEHDGSDDEDVTASTPAPKPKGRKSSGTAASKRKKVTEEELKAPEAGDEEGAARFRKAQNRIAQREFRQRKQQYIRALEARVEILSTDHDDQVDRLRHALRVLLSENNTLRSMISSLGRFIGEELIGGPLQHVGVSRDELLEMINGRSEKTMTDAWQNWPGAQECEALRIIRQEANIPADGLPDMRSSPGPSSSAAKAAKKKTSEEQGTPSRKDTSTTGDKDKTAPIPTKPTQAQQQNARDSSAMPPPSTPSTATTSVPPTETSQPASTTSFANSIPPQPASSAFPDLATRNNFMTPGVFGLTGQMGQDDALLASLFGTDSFASPSTLTPGNGGNYQLQNIPTGQHPSFNLTGFPHGLGQEQQQQQQQQPPSYFANTSATAANNASNQRNNAIHTSANRFLDSLRNLSSNEDIVRVTSIADQLNQLRASQGRSNFFPFFNQDPNASRGAATNDRAVPPQSEEVLSRMTDACIQLAYHQCNYRRDHNYQLPALLRHTQLQNMRPHDPIIDTVPFPQLRDALILQAPNLNLDEVMIQIICSTQVGEGDVLNQTTWLLDPAFVAKYPMLGTEDVLEATNRWRKRMES